MTSTDLDRTDQQPHALLPMSVVDARDTMRVYQDICAAVLTPADVQKIGDREFVKRSGFQKLAVAYGLTTYIVSLDVDRDQDGDPIRAHAIVRATHQSGRSAEGDGACDRAERGRRSSDKLEHDLRATATTRATNRAISNLVAFGTMSAEEVEGDSAAVSHGSDAAPPPSWAQPAGNDDLLDTANAMVHVVRALGHTENPAQVVRVLGNAIRSECDGVIPIAVARAFRHLDDLAHVAGEAPSGPVDGTDTPTTTNQPQEN